MKGRPCTLRDTLQDPQTKSGRFRLYPAGSGQVRLFPAGSGWIRIWFGVLGGVSHGDGLPVFVVPFTKAIPHRWVCFCNIRFDASGHEGDVKTCIMH